MNRLETADVRGCWPEFLFSVDNPRVNRNLQTLKFPMATRRKRIVIKFGTGILTASEGHSLDMPQIKRLVSEVAGLVKDGHDCVLVSSGAVGAGMMRMGLEQRPTDLSTKQACAAIGQSRLMGIYDSAFSKHGLCVAQLLLTHQDLDSRSRYRNAQNTLNRLLAGGDTVPIINENDVVAVEELRFGDNDRLSAEVAQLAAADLLLLLTSVEGLLQPLPGGGQRLVTRVRDVDAVAGYATATKGTLSVGGMVTKLQAAKAAVEGGCSVVIASGRLPGVIRAAAAGGAVGTRFIVKRSARKGAR